MVALTRRSLRWSAVRAGSPRAVCRQILPAGSFLRNSSTKSHHCRYRVRQSPADRPHPAVADGTVTVRGVGRDDCTGRRVRGSGTRQRVRRRRRGGSRRLRGLVVGQRGRAGDQTGGRAAGRAGRRRGLSPAVGSAARCCRWPPPRPPPSPPSSWPSSHAAAACRVPPPPSTSRPGTPGRRPRCWSWLRAPPAARPRRPGGLRAAPHAAAARVRYRLRRADHAVGGRFRRGARRAALFARRGEDAPQAARARRVRSGHGAGRRCVMGGGRGSAARRPDRSRWRASSPGTGCFCGRTR